MHLGWGWLTGKAFEKVGVLFISNNSERSEDRRRWAHRLNWSVFNEVMWPNWQKIYKRTQNILRRSINMCSTLGKMRVRRALVSVCSGVPHGLSWGGIWLALKKNLSGNFHRLDIALDTAIAFWEMLMPIAPEIPDDMFKPEYLQWWFELLRGKSKAVSRDTWNLVCLSYFLIPHALDPGTSKNWPYNIDNIPDLTWRDWIGQFYDFVVQFDNGFENYDESGEWAVTDLKSSNYARNTTEVSFCR